MVKTVINNTKGLEQFPSVNGTVIDNASTFNGATTLNGALTANAAGASGIVFSDAGDVNGTNAATTDYSVTVPAGALVTDLGFICTTQMDCAAGSTITVGFGFSAGAADVITGVQVNNTGSDVAVGTAPSVLAANLATASGTGFGTFQPAIALHSATAKTYHMRITIGGQTMTDGGAVRMFARYTVVK